MTAYEIGLRALALLGETDEQGVKNDQAILNRVLTAVNAVYSDLFTISTEHKKKCFEPLYDIDQSVALPDHIVFDCMIYGVAMWLAQGMGDTNNQAVMSSIYNQKRAEMTRITYVEDIYR